MAGLRSVCVFCGSSAPPDQRYRDAARELGELLARRGISLVYGGARVGLMGDVADAALRHGGQVTGVMPTGLFDSKVGHTGLTDMREVESMHERKKLMYDLSDAFIALPGGFGTLEELAEVATWSQIGLLAKPVVLVDLAGFWEPLVTQLDRMVSAGFLTPASRDLVRRTASPGEALAVAASAAAATPEDSGSAQKWASADGR
jgi:uncharacterized protein (TIGR00730 family)